MCIQYNHDYRLFLVCTYLGLRRDKCFSFRQDFGTLANNKQISFYLTDDEIKVLNEVVYAQDIRIAMDCGEIVTYRFAILALLLNAPELARREQIAWH